MSGLPKLPSQVQRLLELEWEELLDHRKFSGQHLFLRAQQKAFAEARMQETWRGITYGPGYLDDIVENAGRPESSALARERFVQLAEQYLSLWDASLLGTEEFTAQLKEIKAIVLNAIADLWKLEAERFERSLRPRLQADLDSLVDEWTSRARCLELARLRSPDSVLAEGKKALDEVRKLREEVSRPPDHTPLIDELVRIGIQTARGGRDQSNDPVPTTPAKSPADSRERSRVDGHQPESGKLPKRTEATAGSSGRAGRRVSFSDESLREALRLRLEGSSNLKIARALHGVRTPSKGQQRGVSTILKHHFPDQMLPPRVKQTLKK